MQPLIATSGEEWNAEDACDLCITPGAVSVAHLKRRRATVVHGLVQAGGVEVEDVKHAGVRRVGGAAKRARPAGE
jgi:hypothetical protein